MNRIFREKQTDNFTVLPNAIFKTGLSLRAIGLLTFILHLPDDWVLYKTWLYENMPGDGRDAVKTAWKELEEKGFIIVQRSGSHGKGKLPETNYLVYDSPCKMGDFQSPINRQANDRPPINRLRKTRQLLSTNILSTKEQRTNELNANTDFVPAGTPDPSPAVNLELEEITKDKKRPSIPDDSAEIKAEHRKYETELYPEALKLDPVARKRKIADYIQEKKPAFYEPYKDLWNLSAPSNGLAKVDKLSETRLKQFRTRLKDPDFDFIAVMMAIKKNAFLKGDNNRGWRVTWDYIFKNDTNYLKITEGTF